MFRIIWVISIHLRNFIRRYPPTSILLDVIRSRRGLKWGVPAVLLAIPLLFVASTCTALTDGGASRWLYVVPLVCIWSVLKFVWICPTCIGLLVHTRATQCRDSHRSQPENTSAWGYR